VTDFQRIDEIPPNPNSIENGLEDPQPEKGEEGRVRRSWWSWLKGLVTPTNKEKK
jgi:hypothetical protein